MAKRKKILPSHSKLFAFTPEEEELIKAHMKAAARFMSAYSKPIKNNSNKSHNEHQH